MAGRKLPFHRSFTKDFSAEEKRSPGFGIRADMGRFLLSLFPFRPLMPREIVGTYLFFPGYSCPAVILGKTCCSGDDTGLDGSGVCLLYRRNPERFSGENLWYRQIQGQGLFWANPSLL